MKRTHSQATCTTSVIDYNSFLPVQNTIESNQLVEYPCFTALPKDDETTLEFRIDKTDAFVDLNNTYMMLEIQLLKADGSELKTELDKEGKVKTQYQVAPVNNIGCALFENVDLYLSDQKITANDPTYPWWTYVYQLLYCDSNVKKHQLRSNCWVEDVAATFDSYNLKKDGNPINSGFEERYAIFNDSAKVTLYTQVILNKRFDKLLPPQLEVSLRFHRAPVNLSLMGDPKNQYKIKVWDARLYVGRVKLYDSSLRNYERLLSSKGFEYHLQTNQTRVKTVSKGDQNVEWLPFTGVLPKRIYFWQISHEAYNAQIDKNLYNFQSFMLNRFQVFKNGLSLPLSVGFANVQADDYLRLYYNTIKAINSPTTFDIKKSDYNYGYLIVCVDLTNDGNASSLEYDNPKETGSLRIAIDYKNTLPGSVTLFCLGEFDETLKIDGNRQITWIDQV